MQPGRSHMSAVDIAAGPFGQPTIRTMALYRFYFISKQHSIVGVPQSYECPDDAAALMKAAGLAIAASPRAASLEVWDSRRLVGRLPLGRQNQRAIATASAE